MDKYEKKLLITIVILLLFTIITITYCAKKIEERGLKNIVMEIWEGTEDKELKNEK